MEPAKEWWVLNHPHEGIVVVPSDAELGITDDDRAHYGVPCENDRRCMLGPYIVHSVLDHLRLGLAEQR